MSLKSLLKWLSEYWLRHKYRMLLIVILGLSSAFLQATIPFYIRRVINAFEFNQTKSYIVSNSLIILGLGFLSFLVNLFAQRNRAYMNYRIEYEIRKKTISHLLKLDEFFFYKFTHGDILTRLVDDISEKISWFSCSGVFRFVQAIFTIIAIIATMLYINPLLTAFALFPMPFMVIAITKLGDTFSKRYDELQKSISKVYDFIEISFSSIKSIKANLKEKRFSNKFSEIALQQMEKAISVEKLNVLSHYIFFFSATVGIFLVYLIGGIYYKKGFITIGDLVSFQVYVFMMIWPFSDISQFFISAKRAQTSAKRVDDILKFTPVIKSEQNSQKIQHIDSIILKGLSFSINDKEILKDIDFELKRNEKVAIVGMVGSGKSTFLKILARIIPYTEGNFLVNNIDIFRIDLNSYYSLIGYVPQEVQIISDTVFNNITMYHEFDMKSVERVVSISQIQKDILFMKDGLKTKIGFRGSTISGGQKQRIAIARALIKNPRLLILDDATNQIDVDTEKKIWEEISKLNITLVFSTHRTNLLEDADRIYVFDKGQIVERGTHNELISIDSLYRKIYSEFKERSN